MRLGEAYLEVTLKSSRSKKELARGRCTSGAFIHLVPNRRALGWAVGERGQEGLERWRSTARLSPTRAELQ